MLSVRICGSWVLSLGFGLRVNIGALIIRIGSWGPLLILYLFIMGNPQNSTGNYLGPYILRFGALGFEALGFKAAPAHGCRMPAFGTETNGRFHTSWGVHASP